MSYENDKLNSLTPLELASGVWEIIYGSNHGDCSCGECESRQNTSAAKQTKKVENSSRFKIAAKLVAGLSGNREIKLALIQKVHRDCMDYAIVRYMGKENLPQYHAAILKSRNCIESLLEGVLYRVCKLKADQTLTEQIGSLSRSLRNNSGRLVAYDRVTLLQEFIHRTVDRHLGLGAAQSIPVQPMKNALSAARLHLLIFDVIDGGPGYVAYIDSLSSNAVQLECDEPRRSTAPFGKRSWARWRVRHLQPLSYYFPVEHRRLLQALRSLDEDSSSDRFLNEALLVYANA